jgi:hypothetical protein
MSTSVTQARSKRPKRDRCAYCGAPSTTVDHVPPRCIYGDLTNGPPVNLLTVPSCEQCNHPESKDDTYFRDAIALMASRHEEGFPTNVRDAIHRSLHHAGSNFATPMGGMLADAKRAWTFADASFPLLLPGQAFRISWTRVKRTLDRIVRGLYWLERGEPVSAELEIAVLGDRERERFKRHQEELFDEIARSSLQGSKKSVHPEVFAYSVNFTMEDPRIGVFLFVFYRKVIFMALVGPPDGHEPRLILP